MSISVGAIIAGIGFGIVLLYGDYYFLEPLNAFTDSILVSLGVFAFVCSGIAIVVKAVL